MTMYCVVRSIDLDGNDRLYIDKDENVEYDDRLHIWIMSFPVFTSYNYSTQYLERRNLNKWLKIYENLELFYTEHEEVAEDEYTKLLKDRKAYWNIWLKKAQANLNIINNLSERGTT